jgi:lysylphosphatidylglycerol synthetase-like protein (DUF2156 family)
MPFCPACGKPVDANVAFCPNCGYNLQSGGQGAPVPGGTPPVPMPMTRVRPTGVTILAILQMLGGVLIFLVGIAAVSVAGMTSTLSNFGYGYLSGVIGIVGGVIAVIGLIGVVFGYGLWKGWSWAWWATLIFSILGLLGSLVTLPAGVVGLLIEIAILYYLTRPHVRLYFAK